ncbi:uncharacterized protein C1orf21 homolog [Bolinopsis microptera]|uniref:uncharacterized protein C1orf21 homolog n=1 Tax=Bolinopsis microptera TaxID=2820187 RepID=UPI003078D0FB
MGCGISLGKKTVHPDDQGKSPESNGDAVHGKDKGSKDASQPRKGRRDSGLVKTNAGPPNNGSRVVVERTQSQVEFFKMLDAKIEEGADYVSEDD